MKRGLVSTIIPVFNRSGMLVEAVKSVIAQEYDNWEIIIIDDGSTDNTAETIEQLCALDARIFSTYQNNLGPGAARQSGCDLAKGEFIQYLDSDDLLLPSKFRIQVSALHQSPSSGIAYGKTHLQKVGEAAMEMTAIKLTGEKRNQLYPALLESRWWSTSTPLFRHEVVKQIGKWLPLVNEEDWEYESRAAKLGIGLVYCDDFVSITQRHGDHLSNDGAIDPVKLSHRATARLAMYRHAIEAGQAIDSDEWRHFLKSLFLLARQCASLELNQSTSDLLKVCIAGYRSTSLSSWKVKLFSLLGHTIGWRNASTLANLWNTSR